MGLKIKADDLQALRDALAVVLAAHPTAAADYAAKGRTHVRYRWDMSYAIRHYVPGYDITRLYAYLDDTHVDSALRSILGDKFPE